MASGSAFQCWEAGWPTNADPQMPNCESDSTQNTEITMLRAFQFSRFESPKVSMISLLGTIGASIITYTIWGFLIILGIFSPTICPVVSKSRSSGSGQVQGCLVLSHQRRALCVKCCAPKRSESSGRPETERSSSKTRKNSSGG